MESIPERTKRLEGWKLKPYKCPAGHNTIAAGWNIDARPLPPHIASYLRLHGQITEEMAEELLTISLAAVRQDCENLWPLFDSFSDARRAALMDVVFNMGSGKIMHEFPSFVKAVNAQDWQRAADELKYANGLKKDKLSGYWQQLHGDPDGTDDKRVERPEENYKLLVEG